MSPPALRMLVTLGLSSSGPFWRWRQPSGVLKDRDLGEKLVIYTLQPSGVLKDRDLGEKLVIYTLHLLPFMGCIFSIMCHLLSLGSNMTCCFAIPPSCRRTFGGVRLRVLMTGGCLRLPL